MTVARIHPFHMFYPLTDLKALIIPRVRSIANASPSMWSIPEERGTLRLDANESPFNAPDNRYPDGNYARLREALGKSVGLRREAIGVANGSEVIVDSLIRVLCVPGDNIVTIAPTRSVYERRAIVNGVECRKVQLEEGFRLNAEKMLFATSASTKIIFLCSPNSINGAPLRREEMEALMKDFDGVVVVDESYIDFMPNNSLVKHIVHHPKLVVIQSFSHAWGLAAWRVAAVYAVPLLQEALRTVMPHHPVSVASAEAVVTMAERRFEVDRWVNRIGEEREKVVAALEQLPFVEKVFPSSINTFLVRVSNAKAVYRFLLAKGIAVKFCGHLPLCDNSLRISVGLPGENNRLLGLLRTATF